MSKEIRRKRYSKLFEDLLQNSDLSQFDFDWMCVLIDRTIDLMFACSVLKDADLYEDVFSLYCGVVDRLSNLIDAPIDVVYERLGRIKVGDKFVL